MTNVKQTKQKQQPLTTLFILYNIPDPLQSERAKQTTTQFAAIWRHNSEKNVQNRVVIKKYVS